MSASKNPLPADIRAVFLQNMEDADRPIVESGRRNETKDNKDLPPDDPKCLSTKGLLFRIVIISGKKTPPSLARAL